MANARQIMRAIETITEGSKSPMNDWSIAITYDPEQRRKDLGFPALWYHWPADTLEDAKTVFEYFTRDLKVQPDTGAEYKRGEKAFVYIF